MESAGKEDTPEDAERKGFGTTATRAGIIEKLISACFAERKGKKLIPTKDGYNPVSYTHLNVKDLLSSREVENIFENSDFVYMLNHLRLDYTGKKLLTKRQNMLLSLQNYLVKL